MSDIMVNRVCSAFSYQFKNKNISLMNEECLKILDKYAALHEMVL